MKNIKQKTINGMAWSVSERISLQVIQIGISIILARLLDPSEFGLIGMLAIFTSIAQSILDSGFGSALIQKKDATQTDSSSIFYFNLFIGILLASIFFFISPLISKFYNQPLLTPITRVLSLNVIISAFSLVQLSLLRKNLHFKNHFIVGIISVIFSGVCGIVAAKVGLGVWSLVIQTLSYSIAQAATLWIINNWRPKWQFSFASLKSMFSFGSKLLVAGVIETIFKNIYQTLIGKSYTASDVGYYSRALTMETAATVTTSMALGQVIFPAFSPYQDDNITLKQVHSKTIKMSMFLHMPLMIGLIAIAEPLFLFLLTAKWANSIPYFQLLCVAGIFYPIQVQNYNLFRIKGRSDFILKFGILKHTLIAIALAVTYKHGIMALILGQVVVAALSQLIASYEAGKLINYNLSEQVKALIPYTVASIIMGTGIYMLGKLNIESNFLLLVLQISIGILFYFTISKILKSPELSEYISIIKQLKNIRNKK
jgi:O-antigen/teichoic acid export membrane protein